MKSETGQWRIGNYPEPSRVINDAALNDGLTLTSRGREAEPGLCGRVVAFLPFFCSSAGEWQVNSGFCLMSGHAFPFLIKQIAIPIVPHR